MTVTIYPGDNRQWLAALKAQGVFYEAVVCDPPYGLVSIKKRFGASNAAPAKHGTDGAFARASRGFMGKEWDGTGIENDPTFWRAVFDVMLPGAYCFAFSGTRTVHRQMVAMEDAGFILHPLHIWAFGSGFPKAHAADKAIDRQLGAEREVTGQTTKARSSSGSSALPTVGGTTEYKTWNETAPATPEAQRWVGWGYGTQAQKPALEPIVLAQKPFSEKTGAANILRHGVGAVNIDACRVGTDGGTRKAAPEPDRKTVSAYGNGLNGGGGCEPTGKGRHPANLIHDGSPEVVACFPTSDKVSKGVRGDKRQTNYGMRGSGEEVGYGDSGSAARFFHAFPADEQGVYYHPKAGKADRAGSKHPTVKPIALMQHLIRHITPPGGTVLDPFAGSGTTGEAARREGFDCALMEREPEYLEFLYERFKP